MLERILVVANDFPYPPNNGASLDMWGRIQTLKKLGFTVDLVATVRTTPSQEDIQAGKRDVDQLFIVDRERGWKTALSWQPFQVRSRAGLATVPLSREYDAVVLEAEHVASILRNPRLRARKRILRIHNDEVRFARETSRSSKSLVEKVFFRAEAARFRVVYPSVQRMCDALWFISDFEMKKHVKKHPADSNKSFFVPPAVDAKSMRRQSLEGQKVLFIGTLSLANNARAIEWYISNVHHLLCDMPGYSFVIAGNTRGTPARILREIVQSHSNITLYEDPADIQDLYRDAAVFINPVFRGAGLKLKTIDAIQSGIPVVATSTGIEGSGLVHGKHLLVGDSAESFADCVRRLLNDKNLGKALVDSAQDFLTQEYDAERIVGRSLSKLSAS